MNEVDQRRLREGYRLAAALTRRHGTTYFWGAALLPRRRRRHVHAVYAVCRLADDIVDTVGDHEAGVGGRTTRLARFADDFRAALDAGRSDEPLLAAAVHTVAECGIDPECFDRFFAAMAMDLDTTCYESWEDLCSYMDGSAAVIGEMMLPVLEPRTAAAREPARALGQAFQLTNFLRDVAEDVERGRVYLPQRELRRFGVRLDAGPVAPGSVTPGWRALMAFQIERNRRIYREADPGISMLPLASQRCVATARVLYAQILDRIEAADYDVFSGRVVVPTSRKVATAARMMAVGPRRPLGERHHRRCPHGRAAA